jgi:hypothetical protein
VVKPHIKLNGGHWLCKSSPRHMHGYAGATPMEAYQAWQRATTPPERRAFWTLQP